MDKNDVDYLKEPVMHVPVLYLSIISVVFRGVEYSVEELLKNCLS